MPRTASLSGSSRVWSMRRTPSARTVARISGRAPIADFLSVALRVLSATGVRSSGCARRRNRLGTAWRGPIGGRQALADHLLEVFAAEVGDLLRRLQLLQRRERRADGVDRVVGPVGLRQDVLDPGGLDHGAHRTAGDHTGTRSGRLEHDPGCAPLVLDRVRDRRPDHGHGDHAALGDLHALADRLGHLARLADAGALGLDGDRLADLGRLRDTVALDFQVDRRRGGERLARAVVDHLRVEVIEAAEDGQPRALRGPGHVDADAPVAVPAALLAVCPLDHADALAPLPALPGLRRTFSPRYITPLPLYGSGGRSPRMLAATWPTSSIEMPVTENFVGSWTSMLMPFGGLKRTGCEKPRLRTSSSPCLATR